MMSLFYLDTSWIPDAYDIFFPRTIGPVTPLQILPEMESDDLYTIQNQNPKLQPNRPTQFLQQALPSLPYLDFQVGQDGQSLLEKLSRPIWL